MIDRQRGLQLEMPSQQIRIGAVTYLNSRPLVEGLGGLAPHAQLILDYPSRLADALAKGDLDVALIPSVESFSNPNYEVVSDACVSTHSDVFSVKLYCRVHPGAIRTLALDEGSRTSAALTRIMLAERFGVLPELRILPLEKTTRDIEADAVLLIGDRAMQPPVEEFHTVWDLGSEWVNWTGLPFVFAMWVTRKDVALPGIPQGLAAARDAGLEHLEAISREGSDRLNLPYEMVYNYFTKNLHFRLGAAERAGLRLFQELAAEYGFAVSNKLTFRDDELRAVRIEQLQEKTTASK
ncbi:menaquinone biosynthetic enzyme MqnA/MqnD family protein [Planctomicrobium sp. SH527]|uniref:menaquinone biosynthetic enzyme MqnA/MqnD family protein n=1 Tax=Planctomicrobium sp. SH527 TaxID=3448123 RepID=UPI003F5B0444